MHDAEERVHAERRTSNKDPARYDVHTGGT